MFCNLFTSMNELLVECCGEKKDLRKLINNIFEEVGRCQVCWERDYRFLLVVMNTTEWVWGKRNLLKLKDIAKEEISNSPSWIHGQARGWTEQVDWLLCSMVGWNLAILFVVSALCSDMFIYSSLFECSIDK